MFLALFISLFTSFVTTCFFIRMVIWVYERFQFVHYLWAFIGGLIIVLCRPDKVRELERLIYHDKPATPELVEDVNLQYLMRESLEYLRFNHVTHEYEFGNDFVELSSLPDLVTFQTLYDEKADAYFIRYIPKHVGRRQYTLAVNCKLKSPVFDYVCSRQKPI